MTVKPLPGWLLRMSRILLGIGLVLLFEVLLRMFGFGTQYDFILQGKGEGRENKLALNSQYIALHYFHHLPVDLTSVFKDNPWFEDTQFSKNKKPGCVRIFLVGASTTRGFPFTGREISYAGFLRQILSDVAPGREIEVINAGYDAMSSYGILDIVRQLADYEPDMIIAYTGHNEFIGHFGVNSNVRLGQNRSLIDLVLRLQHSRLFLLNEVLLLHLKSLYKPEAMRDSGVNLFKAMLNDEKVTWNERDHQVSEKNFEANLTEIARLGKSEGATVVFSTLVSNLRDFPPLHSQFHQARTEEQKNRMGDLLREGKSAWKSHEWTQALEYFKKASDMDPDFAIAHYDLGKTYEKVNDFARAREQYLLAREKDGIHLRACSRQNGIVREVAEKTHSFLLDMEKVFDEASPHGLVGENFFIEHVHPNVNGHLIMADAIAHSLERNHMLDPGPDHRWHWEREHTAADYVHAAGYTRDEFIRSTATVGRLLLDFPFYHCEKGRQLLRSVGLENSERLKIDSCFKTIEDPALPLAEVAGRL